MSELIFDMKKLESNQSLFEEAAYLLRSLGNEIRLRVVVLLSQAGEMSVSELRDKAGCEQSLLSHHLTGMRAKGILSCRRSGKNSYYSIQDERIVSVLKCVLDCNPKQDAE